MADGLTQLTLHAYDFKVFDEYDENGNMVIMAWCFDRESKPHLLRFHDFPAFCYVELPLYIGHRRINWSGYKAQQVYESICWRMGDNKPFKYSFQRREKLYYYKGGKKYPMLVVLFRTLKAMYECKSKLSKPIKIKDLGIVACKVWETKVPIVRKLLTLRNVKYCQWFTIKGIRVEGEDKISKLSSEYVVDRKTMDPIPLDRTGSWVTKPTVLSFDIETYSDRHTALPDPYCSKHVVYMVSCVFQRLGDIESRKRYIILYGDCNPTDMATVIKVNSEIELIDVMSDLVNEHDPDFLTGYNIFGYDNPYLDTRLKRRLREWKPMGRLINQPTTMKSFSWGSSGYGHNEINMLEVDGRIMIDLYPIIKRDYKLSLYNLNYVGKYFIGRSKYPVTAKQMFETYELNQESNNNHKISLRDYVKNRIQKLEKGDKVEDLYTKLHISFPIDKTPNIEDIPDIPLKEHAMEEMKKVVDYCVVDSDLVLDIFEKIHCWISLTETSNVMGVTPVELFTRGQQLRVLSQVYDEASRSGIVIDERIVPKMDYTGGYVYEPIPGIYHYIPCLDFKSLYPTVMISYNIDFRTFIPPEMMDKIPDDMCHVIEWDEDIEIKTEKDEEMQENDEEMEEKDEKLETVHYRFKFIKQEHLVGILPRLLEKLISERDAVRKKQKKFKEESVDWIVLERRQLSLKYSTNSMYGVLGAQKGGKLPLPEAAACITAKSRESIKMVNKYLESKGNKIVYGDSVTGDTPILIKQKNQKRFLEIQNLNHNWTWENGKEYAKLNGCQVWSDKGFTDIIYVMRHKTKKRLYRITTDDGIVTVTEDHSLLHPSGKTVKPGNIKLGNRLMTKKYYNSDLLKNNAIIKCKTQLEAAKVYHSLSETYNIILNTVTDKSITYYQIKTVNNEIKQGIVKKIEDLGYIDDYVYDLETENHHFGAGVGQLIVHNTDSSMPDIGIKDPTKAYEMSKKIAEELSALFPKPMLVEDEEVYHTMLCIKKKMYLCIKMTKDGKPVLDRDKLKVKGVVPARRDNCKYQRDSYIDTAWKVLLRDAIDDTYNFIIEMCLKLVRREVSWKDLVVVKGLGAHYKKKSYPMKIFSDELCKIGKPASPGDRLEYLIVKPYGFTGNKQLLGYKMRLPSTYQERLDSDKPEHIDYEYYMEKALMNCIQKQLFQIGYNKELAELKGKYLESDQGKILNGLRERGYGIIIDQLEKKFDNNKTDMINYLKKTDLKKLVNPLISYHIKKRGCIDTRMNGEPIKMMVKLIQAKKKYTDIIKSLVLISEIPRIRPAKLNIITHTGLGSQLGSRLESQLGSRLESQLGSQLGSQQKIRDNWIKNKIRLLKNN